jgi:twitching motility protein PilT
MIREGKTHLLYTALQAGSQYGMHTLDQNLAELVGTGQVERSEAEVYVKDPQAFRSLRNRISNY